MSEKSVKELKKVLFYQSENGAETMADDEIREADSFCAGYMDFLNRCRTEREAVDFFEEKAREAGFTAFVPGEKYAPGSKVYYNNRGKAIILATIGKRSLREGVRINAAHIDSPRLDLKPNPMYEDTELALFKTHYYGGIKKYQWTAIPLSLHGVIVKKGGEKVTVNIGEDAGDPRFVVTDLLPHLADEQMKRTAPQIIKGEELNILIGSRPFKCDDESEKVKLNILNLLHEKYGIIEKDFLSAELTLVPALPVCDIGFDRSMIGGYGHDDRVCAYPAAMAALGAVDPEVTCVTVLTDKEEIGSEGNTGLKSSYLRYFIEDLAAMEGLAGRDVLTKSECLSADVNAAFDPTFPDVNERRNAAYLNHGVCVTKYTGSRGKGGTNDASAEFMGRVRTFLEEADVLWQTGELGKVDAGGGGTVAMYIANLGVDVVDMGVPVLSMHAPFEVVSKLDVYAAYRAFSAFIAY
ncbi:MAG TPA: aminopeptidase [Candidatus Onthovicinus excrementipullorum]|nr:aminopeptidase [Candidatus Onthovicinus excrementipullorum]